MSPVAVWGWGGHSRVKEQKRHLSLGCPCYRSSVGVGAEGREAVGVLSPPERPRPCPEWGETLLMDVEQESF